MRGLIYLLLGAVPAVAAPVPKALKPSPAVVLTLAADDRDHRTGDGIRVTVTNHSADDLRWTYTTIPLAAFEIRMTDGAGKELGASHPCTFHSPFAKAIPCRVESGNSLHMRFGLSQCFPDGGRPGGVLKVTVAFEHDGKRYESEPLEVK